MRAVATTTISILRGTVTNGYGDTVDDNTSQPVATGVPASILEQNRRVFLPAEQAFRIVRTYAGRVCPEIDIRKDDRVKDEQTSIVYLVTDLSDPHASPLHPDYQLQLSRTT